MIRLAATRLALALTLAASGAAASAATDETPPFAASPALLADARGHIGQACDPFFGLTPQVAGYTQPHDFHTAPVVDAWVVPLAKGGTRFAFLLTQAGGACRVSDVVVLPPPARGEAFLACSVLGEGDAPFASFGVGIRQAGKPSSLAYWAVDKSGKLVRQPVAALIATHRIRCEAPESGE